MNRHRSIPLSAIVLLVLLPLSACYAQDLRYDSSDHGEPGDKAPIIQPWAAVMLEQVYGGYWAVTGDLDLDGKIEVVSAKNHNENDVHYTSSVVVQKLDGSILWRWGNPSIGRREWHHDVACQIYDWDGDTWPEVIVATKDAIVELDGRTGAERRRIPIEKDASDSIVFCNVSGNSRATDIMVKDRYHNIYVYDYNGDLIWKVTDPGGYRTCHQPRPYDLDGDGKDEIFAGYAMLNSDGSVRWTLSSDTVDLGKGHNDCVRLVRKGETLADWRFLCTYCGAKCLAYVDGNGKTVWEQTGFHYESLNVGRMFADVEGPQFLVDVDHVPRGESPVISFDENGNRLARLVSDYCRQHKLLDWTGDGLDEILLAHNRGIFDNTGKRIATFAVDASGVALQLGDMDGDAVIDVAITTPKGFYIFRNEKGVKQETAPRLGSIVNYTLY